MSKNHLEISEVQWQSKDGDRTLQNTMYSVSYDSASGK